MFFLLDRANSTTSKRFSPSLLFFFQSPSFFPSSLSIDVHARPLSLSRSTSCRMAAVAAASVQHLAAVAAPRSHRVPRPLQSVPEGRRCARKPRKNGDVKTQLSASSPVTSASAATHSASTSTTSAKDAATADNDANAEDKSVLFFAYGALMDATAMQSRLHGKSAGSLPRSSPSSSRAAVAVGFAEKKKGGGGKEGKTPTAPPSSSSPSIAVAFVHRGGWATLVDLRKARALAASPLWLLVPGSRAEEEDRRQGGGWSEAEGENNDENDDDSFISGSCFSSPAHGILYALSSEADLDALAEKEGGSSLRKVEVRVCGGGVGGGGGDDCENGENGEQALLLEAFAFVSSPGLCLRFPLPPRERYLEKMRRGAREAELDERYRAWLERVPSTKDLDGRYQATPAGAAAAAAGVALFAAVVCLLV